MIQPDNSLIEYQKAIQKNSDWKPRIDERRFIPESIQLYRDNSFTWKKKNDGIVEYEINYFDKMLEVLTELGMSEYLAACLLVALYLEAEKHGDALGKMSWVYNSYLKEAGGGLRDVVEQLIRMVQ